VRAAWASLSSPLHCAPKAGKTAAITLNPCDRAASFASVPPNDDPASIPVPSDAAPAAEARVTPMMEHTSRYQAANPGLLLFYRMGDFYELFFRGRSKSLAQRSASCPPSPKRGSIRAWISRCAACRWNAPTITYIA